MTVRELMDVLSTFDGDAEVRFAPDIEDRSWLIGDAIECYVDEHNQLTDDRDEEQVVILIP